jgi:hypothetical protein
MRVFLRFGNLEERRGGDLKLVSTINPASFKLGIIRE